MSARARKAALGGMTVAAAGLAASQVANAADFGAPAEQMPEQYFAPELNWTGAYGGVSAAIQWGDSPFHYDDTYVLAEDVSFGGFVGVNYQMGRMVIGAELAAQSGVDGDGNDETDSPYEVDYTADAKLKLGATVFNNRVLIYGFGGFSGGGFHNQSDDYAFFGLNYGAGAELMATDHLSIGVEVLSRAITDTYGWTGYEMPDAHHQASLRAAFHF